MTPYSIQKAFDNYKSAIFTVDNDLQFWKSFLSLSIKNYQNQDSISKDVRTSVFAVYDIDFSTNEGYLKLHEEITHIKTADLEEHRILFFIWVMNLSLLKCYNAMETFLFLGIWINFFPSLNNPTESKKSADRLQKEIKDNLLKNNLNADTKNNRHLIEFLKSNSVEFNQFSQNKIRIDLTTIWVNYFELLSILRNIIAHQGTFVNNDTLNEIKSKSRDIFERHFDIKIDINNEKHLQPKENNFRDLIGLVNDFVVNTIKFISKENNLSFLKLT